jgi:hypothetical protein
MNDESLEARVERLEDFIGNIDQIRLYANSLQEVIDKYLAPLYIESGSGKIMLIDGYLGDLQNIPRNVIFKIRASHNLVMQPEDEQAIIRFKRGQDYVDFTLRKMVDNVLTRLSSDNYTSGIVYDVYINSQDVALITSSDSGIRALAELDSYKANMETTIGNMNTTITNNYNTLDAKITNTSTSDRAYADNAISPVSNRVTTLETLLSGITKDSQTGIYAIPNGISTYSVTTTNFNVVQNDGVNGVVNLSGAFAFQLPNGCTIANPSSNLAVANKQWVENYVTSSIDTYHANRHKTGTASVSSVSLQNGDFYYKLSQ